MAVIVTLRRWFRMDADTRIVYFGHGKYVAIGTMIRRVEHVENVQKAA